jgi:glycosyltransferase involved in cell wall biosynthesis
MDSEDRKAHAREAVRRAVYSCARHPALFAYSVANEIPADIVRWSGADAVSSFIDELIGEAKRIDAECLCTFGNFPPTEYLHPQEVDFHTFNIYLHHAQPFRKYLERLQMKAEAKPLLLGEIGFDSIREGEAHKSRLLETQIETAFRAGLAGTIVFSYTDDWWRGGQAVEDWQMGVTTRTRQPKPSFLSVQKSYAGAPAFPLRAAPRVSVVVASYNGDRTLKICLDSLLRLNYPDYEIILVDDGSTDRTAQIAAAYPRVRCLRHATNQGLSAARNTGISAATGQIVAFTDSDCRADEDWLYYLVNDLVNSDYAGIGGPNLLPPEDSALATAVMASPGGPAHVMLTDSQAEHIPGCNMAFYKWALAEINGFDPIYRLAGDDVDICWRLEQAGHKIGFCPPAFVWHYRRSTIGAYLKQQHGYGEAEALLVRKHPEYFNSLGGSLWRGRIYNSSPSGLLLRRPVIYRGLFGSAGYQAVYASPPESALMLCTTLEYHVLISLPLWVLSVAFHPLLSIALLSTLLPLGICAGAGAQARLPRHKTHWWSRPLVALLYFLQPIVRGWARYQGRMVLRPSPAATLQNLDSLALRSSGQPLHTACYWAERPVDRLEFANEILRRLEQQGWPNKSDIGWSDYDIELYGSRWTNLQLTTVSEVHAGGKQIIGVRLLPKWSLFARMCFWTTGTLEILFLGLVPGGVPWLWLGLFILLLIAWLFRRDQRNLQSILTVFLDQLAKERGLLKIDRPEPAAG